MEPGTVITVAPEALNTAQTVLLWASAAAIAIVATVGSALMLKGRAWLQAKTGIVVGTDEQLKSWADHAIALAEEKSTDLIKRKVGQLTGPQKLEEAMQFMIARAKEQGLDTLAVATMRDYVLARLGLARMSAQAAAAAGLKLPEHSHMVPIMIGGPTPAEG